MPQLFLSFLFLFFFFFFFSSSFLFSSTHSSFLSFDSRVLQGYASRTTPCTYNHLDCGQNLHASYARSPSGKFGTIRQSTCVREHLALIRCIGLGKDENLDYLWLYTNFVSKWLNRKWWRLLIACYHNFFLRKTYLKNRWF